MFPNNSTSSSVKDEIILNFNIAMCISVLIVIVNVIPIWIIISTTTIRRNMSNKYLLNLLLSHFVVGLLFIVVLILRLLQNKTIQTTNVNGSASLIISFSLIALTVDKFLFIKCPFLHTNLPKWLGYLMMSLCWMIGTIHFIIGEIFLSVSDIKNKRLKFLVIGCVVLLVLLVGNALIFKETRRHIKAISVSITSSIQSTNIPVVPNNNIENIVAYELNNTTDVRKRFIQKKEIRAAYICIYMATSYVIFWIPFIVDIFVSDLNTENNLTYTIYIGMINSIADPAIYISFNRRITIKYY